MEIDVNGSSNSLPDTIYMHGSITDSTISAVTV